MSRVISKDGTAIAFDRLGQGPALILVEGVFGSRSFGLNGPLAKLLAQQFTVITYDRRGRGESTDTPPYSIEREIEDLGALIVEAGGTTLMYGISSGAALALEAANRGLGVTRLALYEAPFVVDSSRPPVPENYILKLTDLIAHDRRGDAVKYFLRTGVDLSAVTVAMMPFMPVWSNLKSAAHTIVYDATIVVDNEHGRPLPTDRWTSATMPTLVLVGGKSPAWMRNGMDALANVLPNAKHGTLDGEKHFVKPKNLAPVLVEFFKANQSAVAV